MKVEKTEPVFELLKSVRMQAMKTQDSGLLGAVQNAEDIAMKEICSAYSDREIDSQKPFKGFVVEWPTKLLSS